MVLGLPWAVRGAPCGTVCSSSVGRVGSDGKQEACGHASVLRAPRGYLEAAVSRPGVLLGLRDSVPEMGGCNNRVSQFQRLDVPDAGVAEWAPLGLRGRICCRPLSRACRGCLLRLHTAFPHLPLSKCPLPVRTPILLD